MILLVSIRWRNSPREIIDFLKDFSVVRYFLETVISVDFPHLDLFPFGFLFAREHEEIIFFKSIFERKITPINEDVLE